MKRKGIILAGGNGTRLSPITKAVSKQLLPIYDKPMIYYPLSTLMLAGIRDVLIISTSESLPLFKRLLGTGESWGISIDYAVQEKPEGIAQAFLIGEEFIGSNPVALVLGDNLFYGSDFPEQLQQVSSSSYNTIFAYYVDDPSALGVVVLDEFERPVDIVEKPIKDLSNWAVPGLYFYENNVIEKSKTLTLSSRNELEISDLNKLYLNEGSLNVEKLGRGLAWLDSGTHDYLLEASEFVKVIEKRTGLKIACPEEIAYRMSFINKSKLIEIIEDMSVSSYSTYLKRVISQ